MFQQLNQLLQKQFEVLAKQPMLFRVNVSGGELKHLL